MHKRITTDANAQDAQRVREATRLYLRLQDTPEDEAIEAEVDIWRAQSAEHERAWHAASQTWWLTGLSEVSQDAVPVRPNVVSRWGLKLAAGGLMAAALSLFVAPQAYMAMVSDHQTHRAEQRQIALEDGSQVVLDSDSAIAVTYHPDSREVRLLKGRAWFDVAHNAQRPFHVTVGDAKVTVTGTAFDVGLEDGFNEVSLAQGGVRLTAGDAKLMALVPGDRVRIDAATSAADRSQVSLASMGSWRRGRLMLEDVPLADGIARLKRYYGGIIVFDRSAFEGHTVTGVYDVRAPEDALRLMVSQHGAEVRKITPWVMVVTSAEK
ncbi:MAG: FecR domain-containing protein [Asticcacaulis sp.]